MTKEKEISFWRCSDGKRHDWQYLGKVLQTYRCAECQLRVAKGALKEATDA